MHTPEQAKGLWCPMVRAARRETERPEGLSLSTGAGFVVGGCNTDALGGVRVPASCRCIADKCAMWRWVPRYGPEKPSSHPIAPPRRGDPLPPTHGYCGLAGRPEVAP